MLFSFCKESLKKIHRRKPVLFLFFCSRGQCWRDKISIRHVCYLRMREIITLSECVWFLFIHVLKSLLRNFVVLRQEFEQFLSLWVVFCPLLEVSIAWKSILVSKGQCTLNRCLPFSRPCFSLLLHHLLNCKAYIPWTLRSGVVGLNTINHSKHDHMKSAYNG